MAGRRRQIAGQHIALAVEQARDQRHVDAQVPDLGVRVQERKHANHVRLHGLGTVVRFAAQGKWGVTAL
jgi:hypothetical protein